MTGQRGGAGRRAGFTLAELLVSSMAAAAVMAAAFSLLASHARLERAAAAAVAAAEVSRVTGMVVPAEVRYAASSDVPALSADTLALRALRGVGIVCSGAGSAVDVRYRGMRWPDAAKDSVLTLARAGEPERALALDSDRDAGGACAQRPEESVRRWTLSDSAGGPGDVLLVFERGSYHLSGGALRYRRGAGGRQPLTGSFLEAGELTIAGVPPALSLEIGVRPDAGSPVERSVHRALLWNWPP